MINQSNPERARRADPMVSRTADLEGVKLHYLMAGHGPAVILLHGYAETSLMWKPIIPVLAERLTVIAPDLPGIGESSIPADGLDMKTAAIRIHALARSLNLQKVEVVGHDIGLMVAYAYAAMYPIETAKLAVMDAFLPGVAGWEEVYNNPGLWHFRFNGPTPEALVEGASAFISIISGTTSPPTRRSRFRRRIARLTPPLTRARTHAGRVGLFCFLSAGRTRILLNCLETKLTMPVLASAAKSHWGTPWQADEAGRLRRDCCRPSGYRTLGT